MIKTIIFDFDSTIYVGAEWEKWVYYVEQCFMSFLKDKKKYDEIKEKYKISIETNPRKMVNIAKQEKFEAENVLEFLKSCVFLHDLDKLNFLSNDFFEVLKEKCSLYIVSMSLENHINFYLDSFQINKENFKGIISMDFVDETKSKGNNYQDIMKNENVQPQEILVVGDNFEVDILPAEKLNMKTLYFNGDFNMIYDYLENNSIMDCSKFRK